MASMRMMLNVAREFVIFLLFVWTRAVTVPEGFSAEIQFKNYFE
jgi:hypothetical protein